MGNRDPRAIVLLDRHNTGTYEPVKFEQRELAREIVIGGQRFEHCGNEPDGVWRYRAEAF